MGGQIYSETPSGRAAYAAQNRAVAQEAKQRQEAERIAAIEKARQDKIAATEKAKQDAIAADAKAKQAQIAAVAKANSDKIADVQLAVAQKQKEQQAAQAAREQAAQAQAEAHQQNQQQAEQNEKDAEANYRQKVLDNNTKIISSLQTLHELFNNPNFDDDAWKLSVAASLVTLNKLCADGQSISCPERFQAVQSSYRASLAEYEKFSADLPGAIDNQDMNKLHECLERLDRGAELMEKATAEAQKINDN